MGLAYLRNKRKPCGHFESGRDLLLPRLTVRCNNNEYISRLRSSKRGGDSITSTGFILMCIARIVFNVSNHHQCVHFTLGGGRLASVDSAT